MSIGLENVRTNSSITHIGTPDYAFYPKKKKKTIRLSTLFFTGLSAVYKSNTTLTPDSRKHAHTSSNDIFTRYVRRSICACVCVCMCVHMQACVWAR